MRNLKRALSLALALVMVLSMMVVGATAVSVDDFSDGADIVNKEAVSVLATLNVINGKDDGSYDPTGTVTRGEMAKMICVILNGGNDPVLGETITNSYTDTASHWAKSFIEYCTTLGIVAGKGDGTFDPNGQVTVAEAAKMVLVALGYNAGVEGYTGINWQINTDVRANALGLYDALDYTTTSADLTRDNAAQMLYNALDVNMVTYDYIITGTVDNAITTKPQLNDRDLGTLLWEKFKAVKVEGVVVANEYANLEADRDSQTDLAPASVNVGSHLDAGKTTIRVTNYDPDTEQHIYKNADYTFNATTGENELAKAVYVFIKPYNATASTASDNANRATVIGSVNISEDNVIVEDASGDTAKDVADDNNLKLIAGETLYAYNYGGMGTSTPSKDGYVGVQKTLIDTDNDGDVNYVLYREMRLGKVTLKADSGDGRLVVNISGNDGTGSYINEDKDDIMGFDNVAKDDYVLTAYIGGRLHVQLAETLTGTIEAYKQTADTSYGFDYRNTNITVDGENYTVSRVGAYEGELTAAVDEFDRTVLDSEATFYLDENGYLIAYGEVDESAYKYAFVWGATEGNLVDADRVKVTLEDGTTGTYDLDDKSDIDVDATTDAANNKISVTNMIGLVFPYTITSNGNIKLFLPKGSGVNGTGPDFTKGLSTLSLDTVIDEEDNLRPDSMDTGLSTPLPNSYYTNNATTFFYVKTDASGSVVEDVDVYNGRNNAPSVDRGDGNGSAKVLLALRNSDMDVGAVAFFNVEISESAGNHMYVVASNYVSSEYCTVDAYLNGSDVLTENIRASLDDGSEVDHNPTIEDGLYLYTETTEGYYELTKPTTESFYFAGTVVQTLNGNKTFVVQRSNGSREEARITSESIVVDNTMSSAVATTDGTVSVGDKVEVIIDSTDGRRVLMLGITEHPNINNGGAVDIDWNIPADAAYVNILNNGTDAAEIANAFRNSDFVVVNSTWTMAANESLTVPTGKTLYVQGGLDATAAGAGINNRGTVTVNGVLSTNGSVTGKVNARSWNIVYDSPVIAGCEVAVEGDVTIANGNALTVAGTLTAGRSIKASTGGSANLVITGHVTANGVDMGTGNVTVNSANSLIVENGITCNTLTVGDGLNAGKVNAGSISATTVIVANSDSSPYWQNP